MATALARAMRRNPTEPERRLWAILFPLRRQGWHFRRQAQFDRYYADFACLHAGLVIEVDGDTHGTDEGGAHDAERTAYLQSRGIHVLRFSNRDVIDNPDGVYSEICSVLGVVRGTSNVPGGQL